MKPRFSTVHGTCRCLLVLLALGHGLSVAEATVLTVSHGQASFRYNDGNLADDSFVYDDSGDTLYQEAWYLNIGGNAQILTGGALTSTSASTKTITYSPTGSFSAVETVAITYSITDTGSAGILNASVEVAAGASGATFSLINYFDYDLGNFGNDSATFDALTGRMVISDGDSNPGPDVTRQGTLFDSWEIAPYSGLQTRIAGGQLLSGTGAPFGPGDFTGAMQWNFTLAPNESEMVNTGGGGSIGDASMPELGQVLPVGALLLAGALRRRRR